MDSGKINSMNIGNQSNEHSGNPFTFTKEKHNAQGNHIGAMAVLISFGALM